MNNIGGLLILMLLVMAVSSAQGISVNAVQSNAAGDMGASYSLGENSGDVKLDLVMNPEEGKMDNHYRFYGSGSRSSYVNGKSGGYAYSSISVTGSSSTYTDYEFSGSNNPYAYLTGSFTSANAKQIIAYMFASDRGSTTATSKIEVNDPCYRGYLTNYYGTAYGTSTDAKVTQSASGAGAPNGKVYNLLEARTYYDYSHVDSTVRDLYNNYPYYWSSAWNKAEAYASRTADRTWADQTIYAYGNPISAYSKSYTYPHSYYIYGSNTYYGTHVIGQHAYTSGMYNEAFNSHLW